MKKAIVGAAVMLAMGGLVVVGTEMLVPPAIQINEIEEYDGVNMDVKPVTLMGAAVQPVDESVATTSVAPEETTTEAVSLDTEIAGVGDIALDYENVVAEEEQLEQVVTNVQGSLRVRQEANTESEIVGKLYPYAVANVLESGEEWTKVESGNVIGYVSNEYLMFGQEAATYIEENYQYCATVMVESLNVRKEPSTESERLGSVNGGKELEIVSEDNEEWLEFQYTDEETAFVSKEFVEIGWNYPLAMTLEEEQEMIAKMRAATASATAATGASVVPPVSTSAQGLELGRQIAAYACQFVGNPYVYGGSSLTNGTDCSGFTMAVYAQFGYSLSHSSRVQVTQGTPVSLDAVEPGDIICYHGHVGLYIGGGQIVHAATESTGIIISNMYYDSPIGARRIVQ